MVRKSPLLIKLRLTCSFGHWHLTSWYAPIRVRMAVEAATARGIPRLGRIIQAVSNAVWDEVKNQEIPAIR